jgi:Tol biopolymer transport system component
VDSPIAFSPDGKTFAYLHQHEDSNLTDLYLRHRDGSPDRALFRRKPLDTDSLTIAWSPDGKTILIPVTQPTKDTLAGLLAVDAANGESKTVALAKDKVFNDPAWLPDGSGVLIAASLAESGFERKQIGILSYPGGDFRALTTDTNSYIHPSISSDGRIVVASQSLFKFELGVAPASNPDALQPVALTSRLFLGPWDWTPDGKLVISQGSDIRIVNPAGGETPVLSNSPNVMSGASCGNGKYVVFRQVGGATSATAVNLWRIDASGGNLKQLTNGRNETGAKCSRDGKWVYYVDYADNQNLKRIPIDGGTPETILDTPTGAYALSPDGTTVVRDEVRDADHKVMLAVYNIGDKKKTLIEYDQRSINAFEFLPDGKSVAYIVREKGTDNLWARGLDGSVPRQLTHFTSEAIYGFRYSQDGSKIGIERGHVESDAVLLRDTAAH